MNVEVLMDRCEGHGLCEATAPLVYQMDDAGFAHVLDDPIPVELVAMAEAGARVCPVAALRIIA